MKNVIWIACLLIVAFLSCKKESSPKSPDTKIDKEETKSNNEETKSNLAGHWKYTENYVSPGIAWHWEKVENGAVITILNDSTYKITYSSFKFWPFAQLKDEGKIGVVSKNSWHYIYALAKNSKDTVLLVYPLRVNNDTLEFSGGCIEGCIYRFRKVE